jgi:hypothetical protein
MIISNVLCLLLLSTANSTTMVANVNPLQIFQDNEGNVYENTLAKVGISNELYLKIMKVPTPEEKRLQLIKYRKQTFKTGYEIGSYGDYKGAIQTLKLIPKESTLYARSQKLISFFNLKYKRRMIAAQKEFAEQQRKKRYSSASCNDPKYGCHGNENCKKCTDCSRCIHCNDHNGSCGVCR